MMHFHVRSSCSSNEFNVTPWPQVGKDQVTSYSELAGREVKVEHLVMYVVKYMMDKGMSLDNTEGMIDASVFPVNYFTLKQVCRREIHSFWFSF